MSSFFEVVTNQESPNAARHLFPLILSCYVLPANFIQSSSSLTGAGFFKMFFFNGSSFPALKVLDGWVSPTLIMLWWNLVCHGNGPSSDYYNIPLQVDMVDCSIAGREITHKISLMVCSAGALSLVREGVRNTLMLLRKRLHIFLISVFSIVKTWCRADFALQMSTIKPLKYNLISGGVKLVSAYWV